MGEYYIVQHFHFVTYRLSILHPKILLCKMPEKLLDLLSDSGENLTNRGSNDVKEGTLVAELASLRNWPVHLDVYWRIWRSFWNWPWY